MEASPEGSWPGWLDTQSVKAVELQITVNFTELFSLGSLWVDFLLSLQMQEQFISPSAPHTGYCVTWTWRGTEFMTNLWEDVLCSCCLVIPWHCGKNEF